MLLPEARGELSDWLVRRLTSETDCGTPPVPDGRSDTWSDDDLQLALWCCYELHYRGFDDVADGWEWDLRVLAFRGTLERHWTKSLQTLCRPVPTDTSHPLSYQLRCLVDDDDGPGLAKYLQRRATLEQFREFVLRRSVYQLKEADPHSFGIPRLDGPVKAALVEIQADEYGGGRPERMHSELFRATMRWLDLSTEYGHYVAQVPAITLAISNLMSLFALHRRYLPALLGHLAILEMTSTEPNRRYAAGARRLGSPDSAARYFDEHVEADAVHEQIAAHDLCDGYLLEQPAAAADVLFGARCCLALDALSAEQLLASWGCLPPRARDLPVAQ
jgi:Iron-containing redox enzyme